VASRNFVFAHLADAHIGAWPRDPAVRAALRESVIRALEEVERRNCEFLLISGDLFHTAVPEPSEVAPIAAALRRLVEHGRRVYVIYGSHDYVAHRTSWLDVLAETGVFLKVAPEAVRAEGDRWTLPFRTDAETGARIAGISGRSHGLDRGYFAAVDAEAFRAATGFKIFQFHAAIREYLPVSLRAHIQGISLYDLPGGCDYYAGGHIHYSYQGEGPEGGLLVNPGAVFGTSLTDLRNAMAQTTHQGVVIVTVRDGIPSAEFVDTAPRDILRVVDLDVSGKTVAQAKAEIQQRVTSEAGDGALVFPHLHGVLADGSLADLGLSDTARSAEDHGAKTVHWDVRDLTLSSNPESEPIASENEIERALLAQLLEASRETIPELAGTEGERTLRELVRDLGIPRADGEARHDYESSRVESALKLLQLDRPIRTRERA
jgi:DNA repair protein SbcD/Mre11